MMNSQSLFVPNYSIYAVACLVALTAFFLDLLSLPPGENLLQLYFLYEFIMIFIFLMCIVLAVYWKMHTPRSRMSIILCWLAAFAAFYVTLCVVCNLKSIILFMTPQPMDEFWIWLEQKIHFGFLPNVYFANLLSDADYVYRFFDYLYLSWFLVCLTYLSFVILGNPAHPLRERFMFSYLFLWFVAGNIVAAFSASVGPIFLKDFYDPATSTPAFLAVSDAAGRFVTQTGDLGLFAAVFKNLILDFIRNQQMVDLNGPSAMPSLHVGIAALLAIHSYHVYRPLFYVMATYLFLILAGSVILQWHYAVDGYVAILLALLIWKLSAYLPAPRQGATSLQSV